MDRWQNVDMPSGSYFLVALSFLLSVLPAAFVLSVVPFVPGVAPAEPAVLSGEGDALREASVPEVPLPTVSAGSGVVAAVDGLELLSAELAGGVVDTLVSLRREHAATVPASATAISATSKGFAELRPERLAKAKFDFMIDLLI
jgi:hypothetical protein